MVEKQEILNAGIDVTEKLGKDFNSMDSNEKYEIFSNTLDDLKNNEAIKKLNDIWNKLTDEQKLTLYKHGKQTSLISGPYYRAIHSALGSYVHGMISTPINTYKHGLKDATSYDILWTYPSICRYFVQFGIFSKPDGLNFDTLKQDIKKDAGSFKIFLKIAKVVVPIAIEVGSEGTATEWIPKIQKGLNVLSNGADRYKKEGCNMVIADLERNKIESETKNELQKNFSKKQSTDSLKAA